MTTARSSRLSTAQPGTARPYVPPSVQSASGDEDPAALLVTVEAEARARGFEHGYSEGLERSREEAEARTHGLVASIEGLAVLRQEILRRAEQDLLHLAARIAETIVREKVSADSSVAVRALQEALSEMPRTDSFTVRCHPAEEAALTAALGTSAGAPGFTIRPDPALSPGGCYVESLAGAIDVRVETQLRVLEHELVARS